MYFDLIKVHLLKINYTVATGAAVVDEASFFRKYPVAKPAPNATIAITTTHVTFMTSFFYGLTIYITNFRLVLDYTAYA